VRVEAVGAPVQGVIAGNHGAGFAAGGS
jgi:hypothetical protein